MEKKEIREAVLKAGAIHCFLGTKWSIHQDGERLKANGGHRDPSKPNDRLPRCSIFVTDSKGITTQSGECDCPHGQYLVGAEPYPWALALLELLKD